MDRVRGGSTVVEDLPHHLKVKGSSLSTSVSIGGEKMVKKTWTQVEILMADPNTLIRWVYVHKIY
jgi:hypothetical protein